MIPGRSNGYGYDLENAFAMRAHHEPRADRIFAIPRVQLHSFGFVLEHTCIDEVRCEHATIIHITTFESHKLESISPMVRYCCSMNVWIFRRTSLITRMYAAYDVLACSIEISIVISHCNDCKLLNAPGFPSICSVPHLDADIFIVVVAMFRVRPLLSIRPRAGRRNRSFKMKCGQSSTPFRRALAAPMNQVTCSPPWNYQDGFSLRRAGVQHLYTC